MLTMDNADRRRAAHEDALLVSLRRRVDVFDAVGVMFISAMVPVALTGFVPLPLTVAWAVLSWGCVAAFTEHRFPGSRPEWVARAGLWGSSILWAALPWLVGSAFVHDEVVITLLAICGFGLATDALFIPQTVRVRLSPMMLFYATSYVLAFMLNGRWLATLSLTVFTTHLVAGSAGIEAIKRRIMELEDASERSEQIDALTGLASAVGAARHLEDQVAAQRPIVCVAIDIDYFSAISDHLGNELANDVLRSFARQLGVVLEGWFLARIDGDRFLAIGLQPLSIAELEALPLIEVDMDVHDLDRLTIALSAGIATSQTAGTAEALLRQSGLALHEAKRSGRQQVVHITERLLASADDDADLAQRAQQALAQRELVAWAQPIVNVRTGEWLGFELLARWPQADGSEIGPARFVPVIEAQGGSRLLGHLMLDEAVNLLGQLAAAGRTEVFATVNLSPLHLIADDLPTRIAGLVEAAGVDPTCLVLEMTESERLPDTDLARRAFARLRDLGVGIAIDDVGSGWSSLNQLMSAPFTHMKVDRELIKGADERDAGDLLASLRQLAERAGQRAIAEGIEHEGELAVVRQAGFELAQGYLFARPMPIDIALAALRSDPFSADIA